MKGITYKKLTMEDVHHNMLKHLIRHQITSKVWFLDGKVYKIKEDYWDDRKK